ncbi:hypothetical protein AX774_g6987, partial [Zancudomyces culisetae]
MRSRFKRTVKDILFINMAYQAKCAKVYRSPGFQQQRSGN